MISPNFYNALAYCNSYAVVVVDDGVVVVVVVDDDGVVVVVDDGVVVVAPKFRSRRIFPRNENQNILNTAVYLILFLTHCFGIKNYCLESFQF
jgi:hypothetical protein